MWILIDLIIIGIIALSTFIGYKQGLVKGAIKILSFFIAIVVALILYKPISNIVINNTSIDDNIKNTIIEKIKPDDIEDNQEVAIEDSLTNKIIGEANNTIEEIANAFSVKLVETGILLLLYILIKIALRFVSALADLIAKLPILKQINKTGGIVYGLIKGVVMVYVILAVVYLVSPLIKQDIPKEIDNTIVTKHVYNNNILLNIIF